MSTVEREYVQLLGVDALEVAERGADLRRRAQRNGGVLDRAGDEGARAELERRLELARAGKPDAGHHAQLADGGLAQRGRAADVRDDLVRRGQVAAEDERDQLGVGELGGADGEEPLARAIGARELLDGEVHARRVSSGRASDGAGRAPTEH